jgi:hypothetical protein
MNNSIDAKKVDPMREAFENITYLSLQCAGSHTAHGLRRKPDGEYMSDLLEDHWNTFQEGWEEAIKYLTQKDNPCYTDIVSNGGLDPRR